MDVEVNLVVDPNRKMFRDCESVYGITNFERVTKKDGTKTKMVKCQPKTLFNLVDVLRHHVHLEPKKRVVKPCINHANTCTVCLSLGHKKCDKTIRCAQCAESGHSIDMCHNYGLLKCFNCVRAGNTNTDHRADRDECPILAAKTIEMNKWLINIMMGEGIIKNEHEICKTPRADDDVHDDLKVKKIVLAELEKRKYVDRAEFDKCISRQDQEIAIIHNKVEKVRETTDKLAEEVSRLDLVVQDVKLELSGVKTNLESVKSAIESNHMETKNMQAASQQSMSENFSQLFSMIKGPQSGSATTKTTKVPKKTQF
jgi:hypothetical protein